MRWRRLALCLVLLASATALHAGGLVIDRTRLLYAEDGPRLTLRVANTETWPLLIQAWVDQGQPEGGPETASAPVMPVPALFRLAPGQIRNLQLVGTLAAGADASTQNVERLYWLNLNAVPPHAPSQPAEIQLATRLQLKVVYRPAGLPSASMAIQQLRHAWHGGGLQLTNASANVLQLVGLRQGNLPTLAPINLLLLPGATQWLPLQVGTAEGSFLDDDGQPQPLPALD